MNLTKFLQLFGTKWTSDCKQAEDTTKLQEMYSDLIIRARLHVDSYKYSPLREALNKYCLNHPETVAELVFSDASDRMDVVTFQEGEFKFHMRHGLIFAFSMDNSSYCEIKENPKWTIFMRKYIIPRIDELEDDIKLSIEWYQDRHGL